MQEDSKEAEPVEDVESAKLLAKYRKMLKIGMPRQSVINRMRQDAVNAASIAKLFPDAPEGQKQSAVQNGEDGPTAEQDLKLKKYRKMLKIHMPRQSVINRMVQDQMGPELIRFLFPEAPEAVAASKRSKKSLKTAKDVKGGLMAAVKGKGGSKGKVAAQPKDEEKTKEPPKPKVPQSGHGAKW